MLSDFGWLVVVWVIWMVVFFATTYLIRFTMRGQQEFSQAQEDAINAARDGHTSDQAPPIVAGGPGAAPPPTPQRPPARPPQPLGPPISAT